MAEVIRSSSGAERSNMASLPFMTVGAVQLGFVFTWSLNPEEPKPGIFIWCSQDSKRAKAEGTKPFEP